MSKDTKGFMAMKGAGYYSRATIGAKHVMDNAAEMVLGAVDRMEPGKSHGVFRATDMGAADGGTSLDMWGRVLARVRDQTDRPIEIIYTDLPKNDFSQVFQQVHGLTGNRTYAQAVPGVHVMASGTSFHDAILPPGTLDLGFTSTASHYITQVPRQIPGHVHMVGATGDVRAAYEAKGAADWENFMLKRATEMKPGARLCLFNFGIDGEVRYLGNTGGVNMFDTFARLWYGLADDGILTLAEAEATNFPQVYRDEAQFCAPLQEGAKGHAAGLRLEHVEARVVRCPFAQAFEEDGGDPADFARNYIPTLRSWSEPSFASGISTDRPGEERVEILDEFYGRYQAEVAAVPEGHGMDYVHIYQVIRKDL
ncbi:MAG: SAM-dependent methyltransferase [Pseudomonadota bacterium]